MCNVYSQVQAEAEWLFLYCCIYTDKFQNYLFRTASTRDTWMSTKLTKSCYIVARKISI